MSDIHHYFAYASLLDPERLTAVAPGARFRFIAHFPETRLVFSIGGDHGRLASLESEAGNTVWGGVFEIPSIEFEALSAAEAIQGRKPGWPEKAVDRAGNKWDVVAFTAAQPLSDEAPPDREELAAAIRGARYWNLPAGWVLGLEDLGEGSDL